MFLAGKRAQHVLSSSVNCLSSCYFAPPPQHVLNTSSLPCKRSQYVVDDDDDDDDDDEMMTVLREFYRLDLTMLTKIRLTDDNDD